MGDKNKKKENHLSPETEELFNKLVVVATTNIYSLSKNQDEIILTDFVPNLIKGHEAFYAIANYASVLFTKKLYLDMNLWNYIKFKIKHKKTKTKKVSIFNSKKLKDKKVINVNDEIYHICKANYVDHNTFDKIWEEFYE